MRRLARLVVIVAPVGVVLVLGEIHAHLIGHYPFTGTNRFAWILGYIALLELAAYVAGLPDSPRSAQGALWTSVGAVLGGAGAISLIQLAGGGALLPRFVVLGSALLLFVIDLGAVLLDQRGQEAGAGATRVLAVVGPEEADTLRADLSATVEQPAELVAVLAPDEAAADATADAHPLVRAADAGRVSVVVLGREAQVDEHVVTQAAVLHSRGVRVRTLTMFYDEWLGKLPVSELERISLMFDIQELHAPRYARLKRVLDLAAGIVGVALMLVVVPFVALADLAANRGPLLYRQPRVGKNGRVFTIVKFRTMTPHDGPSEWTATDDPRLGTVGRFLRRIHVDELPQALNLLRGELSLVGPRPEQPHYVAELTEKIPFYEVRHLVNPGVTGWAQVKFPYGASVADALEKLQYEFYYLRHQGPVLDLRILARTLRSIARFQGR